MEVETFVLEFWQFLALKSKIQKKNPNLRFIVFILKSLIFSKRQWSNPSTLNQVKGRGEEEYMTYGERESLVRGKPSKLKLGSVFSFEMQSPITFIPRGKDEKWQVC